MVSILCIRYHEKWRHGRGQSDPGPGPRAATKTGGRLARTRQDAFEEASAPPYMYSRPSRSTAAARPREKGKLWTSNTREARGRLSIGETNTSLLYSAEQRISPQTTLLAPAGRTFMFPSGLAPPQRDGRGRVNGRVVLLAPPREGREMSTPGFMARYESMRACFPTQRETRSPGAWPSQPDFVGPAAQLAQLPSLGVADGTFRRRPVGARAPSRRLAGSRSRCPAPGRAHSLGLGTRGASERSRTFKVALPDSN